MPARRNLAARPNEYLADDGTWPEGPLEDDAPDEAEFVMEISQRLKNACKDRSKRSVARDADMDPQTILNIIKGATWCEVPTIYRLEKALQLHLWSRTHVPPSRWVRPEPPDD